MAFVEDLSPFFDPQTPGIHAALYDGATPINVELEPQFFDTFDPSEGYFPRLFCPENAVPGIAHGKVFVIAGGSYTVREIRGQHTGVLELMVQPQ